MQNDEKGRTMMKMMKNEKKMKKECEKIKNDEHDEQ